MAWAVESWNYIADWRYELAISDTRPKLEDLIAPPRDLRALAWLTWANVLLVVVLLITEWLIAERGWLSALITYMPQQPFALPGIALALWAAIRRKWFLLGVTICAIVVLAFGILGFAVSFPREPTGARFRVMTYNVHSCEHGAAPVADVIIRESPDVAVLQETRTMYGVDPVSELTASLAGWRVVSAGDVAIATRHPIQSLRSHAMPMSNRRALEVSVKVGARSVTIIAAHLSTSPTDESLTRLRRPLSEYMRRSADIRMKQAAALKAIADAAREPVIIAGDLNTPPRGLVYSGLRSGYTDSFAACGFGRGLTYPSRRSLMRIDYVFAGPGIDPVKCSVPDTRASDHRPVVVDLSLE